MEDATINANTGIHDLPQSTRTISDWIQHIPGQARVPGSHTSRSPSRSPSERLSREPQTGNPNAVLERTLHPRYDRTSIVRTIPKNTEPGTLHHSTRQLSTSRLHNYPASKSESYGCERIHNRTDRARHPEGYLDDEEPTRHRCKERKGCQSAGLKTPLGMQKSSQLQTSNPYSILVDVCDDEDNSTWSTDAPPPGFNEKFDVILVSPAGETQSSNRLIDFDDSDNSTSAPVTHCTGIENDTPLDRLAEDPLEQRKYMRSSRHRAPRPNSGQSAAKISKAMQNLKDDFHISLPKKKNVPIKRGKETTKYEPVDNPLSWSTSPNEHLCHSRFLASVATAIESARTFQGCIHTYIELGQVLLHTIKPSDTMRQLKEDQVREILAEHSEFGTFFGGYSNAITTRSQDLVSLLLILEITENPIQVWATWELVCQTTDKQERKIVVDALEMSEPLVTVSEEILGVTYFHIPQRVFDARHVITGSVQRTIAEVPGSGEIVGTLHTGDLNASGGSALPSLTGCESSSLPLQAVQLRSSVRYRVPESDWCIEFIRVCESNTILRPAPVMGLPPGAFKIPRCSEDELIARHGLWYEIRLVQITPNPAFAANQVLHDGEEATWTAGDVVDGASLRELELLTAKVVQAMDNVGVQNKGPCAGLEQRKAHRDEQMRLQREQQEQSEW